MANNNNPPKTLTIDDETPATLQTDDEGGGVTKMTPPDTSQETEFEKQNKRPEWYGFTPSNVLSNIYSGAKGLVGSTYEMGKDLAKLSPQVAAFRGPEATTETLKHVGKDYLLDPAVAEQRKAQEVLADTNRPWWQRQLVSAGHSLASEIPMVGPWAASLGEQAGKGDVGGAAGQALGTIGAGEAMAHPVETVKAPLRALDKITRGTPMTEAGRIEAAKQQALTVKKPSMNETEYANQVSQALPDLQKIAQDNKGKIKTPRQAVRGINARISEIEQPIREHLENLPPTEVVHPDQYLPEVQKAVDDALKAKSGSYTPKEIEKAKQTVNEFLGDGVKRPIEIERNRMRLNQDADAYFHADTAGKRAIDVSDATAIAQRAAANKIRDILYGDAERPGALENFGVSATDATGKQVPIRDVRKQVGNLINVRDHFEDAITRAEATGDWSPFEKWRSGPSLAAGGLGVLGGGAVGGPVGALFGALAGEGVKAWADYLRSKNPNLNTEKMFRNLADTSAPNVSQIQTRAPVRAFQAPIGPAVPEGGLPPIEPAQRPLGFAPSPEEAPLFSIPQSPRAPRPDFEEPRLAPIQGEQQPLNLPPESAPLFNIQTPNPLGRVGEAPKVSPTPVAPAELPPIGGPGQEGVLGRIEETPRRVYRAQNVGETKMNPRSHAHATESREEAEHYKEGREAVEGKPQEVRSVDLSKLNPEDYTEFMGPNGKKWVKFNRQLTTHELEEIKEPEKKR